MTMELHQGETGLAQQTAAPVTAAVARMGSLMPRSFGELMALAKLAADSGLAKVKSPEQAATIIMTGIELGLTPMQALRGIYSVEGTAFLSADMMVALVTQSGTLASWEVVEKTADGCTITAQRAGRKPVTRSFTKSDATTAKLGSVHATHPAVMLYHRCCAVICREVWPDILLGMYVPEEREVIDVRAETVQTRTVPAREEPAVAAAGGSDGGGRNPPSEDIEAALLALIAEVEAEGVDALASELRAATTSGAVGRPGATRLAAAFKARKAALGAPAVAS